MGALHQRVEFAEETNPWSMYICEDGTRFRIRNVLVSVHRTNGRVHELKFNQIIEQIEPDPSIKLTTGVIPD